jgi:hypothetical protein
LFVFLSFSAVASSNLSCIILTYHNVNMKQFITFSRCMYVIKWGKKTVSTSNWKIVVSEANRYPQHTYVRPLTFLPWHKHFNKNEYVLWIEQETFRLTNVYLRFHVVRLIIMLFLVYSNVSVFRYSPLEFWVDIVAFILLLAYEFAYVMLSNVLCKTYVPQAH